MSFMKFFVAQTSRTIVVKLNISVIRKLSNRPNFFSESSYGKYLQVFNKVLNNKFWSNHLENLENNI